MEFVEVPPASKLRDVPRIGVYSVNHRRENSNGLRQQSLHFCNPLPRRPAHPPLAWHPRLHRDHERNPGPGCASIWWNMVSRDYIIGEIKTSEVHTAHSLRLLQIKGACILKRPSGLTTVLYIDGISKLTYQWVYLVLSKQKQLLDALHQCSVFSKVYKSMNLSLGRVTSILEIFPMS